MQITHSSHTSYWTWLYDSLTWVLIIIINITSIRDLQPSTATTNQLPGQLISTQIRIRGPNCFKFHHSIDNTQHKLHVEKCGHVPLHIYWPDDLRISYMMWLIVFTSNHSVLGTWLPSTTRPALNKCFFVFIHISFNLLDCENNFSVDKGFMLHRQLLFIFIINMCSPCHIL